MKSQSYSNFRLRITFTDLIVYGNLAFTFIFFSTALSKGCNHMFAGSGHKDVAESRQKNINQLLIEKGNTVSGFIADSQK
ncbi:MAG TPA: hypothetical protein VFN30_06685 [Chitinophagaceae bacterium]|nr:hypothetical protein [Chitinophagaceae bacterium]